MERRLSFLGDVIGILTITALVLARVGEAKVEKFHYYITVVTWPPSFCNDVQNNCKGEILDYFTLHGLFPMYSNHKPVPAYEIGKKGFDSKCTDKIPMSRENAKIKIENFKAPLRQAMTKYMRSLKNPDNYNANLRFQLYEWVKHGMCFIDPEDPTVYFETALIVPQHMNLTKILKEEGNIVPSNEHSYNIATVARIISTFVKKQARIHCNRDANGKMQLLEVEVCFEKTGDVKDCPDEFLGCDGSDYIWFPSA